ncbi:Hypothetical protein PHPALM_4159 [Phytophthora palmivora]|uniref:Uncharacterized protein n=1 Tax=Phytophthora palmivora TaxID=4796 RepID=A0A2P4YKI0_9STRA|nr:Hypothetical protein PHPALM_4159 [Phytophthora palmivora]
MRNDNFNRGNHKTGVLKITTTTVPQEGYLLTEVFLSSGGLVVLESERSAQVVIEDGVLATNSKKSDLIVEASGPSTVFLSDTNAAVMVGDLVVEASNMPASSCMWQASRWLVMFETAGDMILETQRSGTICTSAEQVIVEGDYISESASGISMPNAPNMFGATGTLACNEVDVPVREPVSVTRGSPTSNSASATNSASLAGVDADTNVSIVSSALSCTTQFGAMFAVSLTTMGML